mmetsp:Transcript_68390/g.182228  ORF Transcript_68390/g.182228 Transcript_68390/m.182228 type:complete len:366 (-) Transcript_68390:234-1331(-)
MPVQLNLVPLEFALAVADSVVPGVLPDEWVVCVDHVVGCDVHNNLLSLVVLWHLGDLHQLHREHTAGLEILGGHTRMHRPQAGPATATITTTLTESCRMRIPPVRRDCSDRPVEASDRHQNHDQEEQNNEQCSADPACHPKNIPHGLVHTFNGRCQGALGCRSSIGHQHVAIRNEKSFAAGDLSFRGWWVFPCPILKQQRTISELSSSIRKKAGTIAEMPRPILRDAGAIAELPRTVTKLSCAIAIMLGPILELPGTIGKMLSPILKLPCAIGEMLSPIPELLGTISKMLCPILKLPRPICEMSRTILELLGAIAEMPSSILEKSGPVCEMPRPVAVQQGTVHELAGAIHKHHGTVAEELCAISE